MDENPDHGPLVAEIDQVYREQSARLWRALLAYSGSREIASDAMSEAFTQLVGRRGSVHSPDRWVWRAAFKVAGGELQRRRERAEESLSSIHDFGAEPSASSRELLAALAELPPRERASVALFYLADMDARAVANLLGISATTVRVHLNHGRKRLRTLLEETDHD